jgi:hypothetical protein
LDGLLLLCKPDLTHPTLTDQLQQLLKANDC